MIETIITALVFAGLSFVVKRVLDCVRAETPSGRLRPKCLFGYLALGGIPSGVLGSVIAIQPERDEWGFFPSALGVCWLFFLLSFIIAVVSVIRREKPLWPAVTAGIVTLLPALLFLFGALQSFSSP